jgi:hypothetical protein
MADSVEFGSLPRQPGQLSQQFPVKAKVEPEALGNGKDELPMRHPHTDVFGNVDRGDQCAFLVA